MLSVWYRLEKFDKESNMNSRVHNVVMKKIVMKLLESILVARDEYGRGK